MALRNQSGSWAQTHQRNPRAMRSRIAVQSILGLRKSSVMKKTTATTETTVRIAPGTSERRKSRIRTQKGTLGCGVERSRLPHCEQAWAFRGFGWSLGQSFMS